MSPSETYDFWDKRKHSYVIRFCLATGWTWDYDEEADYYLLQCERLANGNAIALTILAKNIPFFFLGNDQPDDFARFEEYLKKYSFEKETWPSGNPFEGW